MFVSADKAAEMWGISPRQVQRLLAAGRIPGAQKFGRSWMIPKDAEKPEDPRRERERPPIHSLSPDLTAIVEATTVPFPLENPDAILATVPEDRLRLHYESELAYLRGNFARVIACFREIGGDDAGKLRASSIAIAAAISTGDYSFYMEIEAFLKQTIQTNKQSPLSTFAELMLANAYTGAIAPKMVPDWLKDGDFDALMPQAKPDAAYKRAKYFQCLGNYEAMLAVAQTMLAFCVPSQSLSLHAIYFQVARVIALCGLKRAEEAERYLLEALRIALPHGFITPFAESATAFGGLLEILLLREYPSYFDAITGQWKRTFDHWMSFHNQFTKDNITSMLSLREHEMASLAAQGVPNAEIAKLFHISVGRVKMIMNGVYGKLFINSRKELSQYIL